METFNNAFNDKDILITGGCGSIGSEITRQLTKYDVKRIRVFDQDESGQFRLGQELKSDKIRSLIGNVRDKKRLMMAMKGVDIVFHAAALKHVPLCEYNPFEAVKTNVLGTQNVIEAARESDVGRFIFISTDKAVGPVNVMGATKLLSERLVLNAPFGDFKTKFACVRFGNVVNSNGSVIPTFREQIKAGGPVTVTSREMTRFFMSISDAVNLVLKAAEIMNGREIFILKMKSLRIIDVAEVMIEELAPIYNHSASDIRVKYVGIRPGEKLHESLMTREETRDVEEKEDMFILRPKINIPHFIERLSFRQSETGGKTNLEKMRGNRSFSEQTRPVTGGVSEHFDKETLSAAGFKGYNSRNMTPLSKSEIKSLLRREGIIPENLE